MTQRKLAVFVEGQTEQIFLKALIKEIAGEYNVTFVEKQLPGKLLILSHSPPANDAQAPATNYFVLLVDCQNDERVKSVVLEQRNSLTKANYDLILGLRDLYPNTLAELEVVKAKLTYRVPTAGVPTHILLAVSEIEAWFLQEHTHYARVDNRLDIASFKRDFGFDPLADCAEEIAAPAKLLHDIYSSVGKAYRKDRKRVERTVNALDYDELYLNVKDRIPHMREFVGHIDSFLS